MEEPQQIKSLDFLTYGDVIDAGACHDGVVRACIQAGAWAGTVEDLLPKFRGNESYILKAAKRDGNGDGNGNGNGDGYGYGNGNGNGNGDGNGNGNGDGYGYGYGNGNGYGGIHGSSCRGHQHSVA